MLQNTNVKDAPPYSIYMRPVDHNVPSSVCSNICLRPVNDFRTQLWYVASASDAVLELKNNTVWTHVMSAPECPCTWTPVCLSVDWKKWTYYPIILSDKYCTNLYEVFSILFITTLQNATVFFSCICPPKKMCRIPRFFKFRITLPQKPPVIFFLSPVLIFVHVFFISVSQSVSQPASHRHAKSEWHFENTGLKKLKPYLHANFACKTRGSRSAENLARQRIPVSPMEGRVNKQMKIKMRGWRSRLRGILLLGHWFMLKVSQFRAPKSGAICRFARSGSHPLSQMDPSLLLPRLMFFLLSTLGTFAFPLKRRFWFRLLARYNEKCFDLCIRFLKVKVRPCWSDPMFRKNANLNANRGRVRYSKNMHIATIIFNLRN